MANEEHLQILHRGVDAWNEWRNVSVTRAMDVHVGLKQADLNRIDPMDLLLGRPIGVPDLDSADLSGADLSGADLREANLRKAKLCGTNLSGARLNNADLMMAKLAGANFREANLWKANFIGANVAGVDFRSANLWGADLFGANLSGANLRGANLNDANLRETNLAGADLSDANLSGVLLIRTDLRGAILTGSVVYGAAVWDIKVNEQTKHQNLSLNKIGEPGITVDSIKVAQFIYLLLNNQEIRETIDTVTSKVVLILGRFSKEGKRVLDAIRNELRKPEHNYVPIVFDFQPSTNQTTVETVQILATMSRFIIADLTDARSALQELGVIVPALPSVAVRLLIKKSEHEHGMLDYIRRYRSVVENTYEYESLEELIASIKESVVGPAEAKVKELRRGN